VWVCVYVCVYVCVCVSVCVRVLVRVTVCDCVTVYMCVSESVGECGCVRERERECVCACARVFILVPCVWVSFMFLCVGACVYASLHDCKCKHVIVGVGTCVRMNDILMSHYHVYVPLCTTVYVYV